MLNSIDTLLFPKWVVPVRPRGQLLRQYAVAIHQGRVVGLLPRDEALAQFAPETVIELPEHALFPGLINLHTHAAMTLLRGYADDLPLMRWLAEFIWPAEGEHVAEDFVRDGSLLACLEMLRGGVTCFSDMYFFPEQAAEAAIRTGMRTCLGLIVTEFPTRYAADADDYLRKGFDLRDRLHGQERISTCLAPHAPYTVSNRSFEKVLTFAEQLNLNIHTHLHETHDEIARSESEFGLRPIARLANQGVLGPNLIAAHGVHLNQGEIELLAERGCHIAHCPASNLKLASGIAPIKALLGAGINVGIGTDGAASNNTLDMLHEMRLAALLAKGATGDAEAVPAWQALEMATINAAVALGMDHEIGSIEIGKAADLMAIDLSAPETTPCFDPVSHLVYAVSRRQVSHVWVGGENLLWQGQLVKMQEKEILEKAKAWQNKLR
jgi:5-methylthioadenosine/S-adenosylhomocysteine deaminase